MNMLDINAFIPKGLLNNMLKPNYQRSVHFYHQIILKTGKILLGNTWAGHLQNGEIFFGQMRPKLTCLGQMH